MDHVNQSDTDDEQMFSVTDDGKLVETDDTEINFEENLTFDD